MNETPPMPPAPQTGPWPYPEARPARKRRARQLVVGVGAAVGVAIGATALATAATATNGAPPTGATVAASGSNTTPAATPPGLPTQRPFGRGFPGGGSFGRGGLGMAGGSFIYGQFTIQGPNGYETLAERTGTVSDVTDTSGSTWSLTVKSADGTSGKFTVDTGTSVNGGEMGIGSVKSGDTVRVVAVVSGDSSTAKQVTDETVLKANGGTWQPTAPKPGSTGSSGTPSNQSLVPPV